MTTRADRCGCGSGLQRYEIHDARGIFVARACAACDARVRAPYRPEIFIDPNYHADEAIEEE